MKTLADFKRIMVKGSKWDTYNFILGREMNGRECRAVNGKSFSLTFIRCGEVFDSWCDFPKAKAVAITTDAEGREWITFYQQGIDTLRDPMIRLS